MVFDLLHDPSAARQLTIHETVEDGVYVEGLTEFVVANAADCLGIVAKGQANRYRPVPRYSTGNVCRICIFRCHFVVAVT